MSSPSEWFVYWAVPAADVDAAVNALQRWHGQLQDDYPGLQTARYVRPDARPDRPDRHTVMETYAPGAALSAEALANWVAVLRQTGDAVSAPWRLGSRHIEAFQRLP
jgi:hypothetical protein